MLSGTVNKLKAAVTPALVATILAAVLYFTLSSLRLEEQGLYYDEVHQATVAFAFVGQYPFQFAPLVVNGLPLMNMSYSGAIKTALYGSYLRMTGKSFSVESWRLTGIISVTCALFLFGFLLRKKFPFWGLFVFFILLLTDVNFILTTRHDWGPVALAAFFRLLLISVWLKGELSKDLRPANSFWLGALVGISIFEKLSSVVLLVPLFLMIFASPLRRTWKHILATFAGGLVGTSPLIFANFYSYINRGYFISLQFQPVQSLRTFASFFDYIQKYLSMGAGNAAEGFILGLVLPGSSVVIETVLILLILVGIMILSPIRRSQSVFLRSAWIMLLGFIGIAVAFFYFPQNTGIYHWIVGTPFQYTCIGLFVADDAVKKEPAAWKKNLFKNLLLGLLVMFSVVRLGGLITLESAFLRGDSSAAWDISLTRIGEFAAQKQNKAIFIAGDWGVANQMICFVNGDPDVVFQVDPASGNVDEIIQVILHGKARDVYLIFPRLVYFTKPETRSLIAQRLSIGLSPGWEQQPSEEAIKGLKEIVVFKYKKIK